MPVSSVPVRPSRTKESRLERVLLVALRVLLLALSAITLGYVLSNLVPDLHVVFGTPDVEPGIADCVSVVIGGGAFAYLVSTAVSIFRDAP